MNASPSRITTVVFADVAGSSKLYQEIGNDEASRRINAVIARLAQSVREHRGSVIKTIGDEIMCHFSQASDACDAVMAFQRIGEQTLPLRIGVSTGQVIEQDNDLFGDAVNDAAAVAKIARARQIITTDTFRAALDSERAKRLSVFDHVKIKGHVETSAIYRLEWESSANAAATSKHTVIMASVASVQKQLALGYHNTDGAYVTRVLTPKDVPLHIGREPGPDQLVSPAALASRDHCHVDYAHGKFVLADHSTNGTYVRNRDGVQIYLRRQETPLVGSGDIGLGEEVSATNPFIIRFQG